MRFDSRIAAQRRFATAFAGQPPERPLVGNVQDRQRYPTSISSGSGEGRPCHCVDE